MLPVIWHPLYNHPVPAEHKFPMLKYDLIPEQLHREGIVSTPSISDFGPVDPMVLCNTHHSGYVQSLEDLSLSPAEIRKIGFELSHRLYYAKKQSCRAPSKPQSKL